MGLPQLFDFYPTSDTSTITACLFRWRCLLKSCWLFCWYQSCLKEIHSKCQNLSIVQHWHFHFQFFPLFSSSSKTSNMPIIPSAQKRFPPLSLFYISILLYSHNPISAQLFVSLVIIRMLCQEMQEYGALMTFLWPNKFETRMYLFIYLFIY